MNHKKKETADKTMNDDQITSLQNQIKSFKTESLKLNQILELQKREIQKSKNRQTQSSKDQQYLYAQLKEARKQKKLMQVGIKRTTAQNDKISNFFERYQPNYQQKQATIKKEIATLKEGNDEEASLDIITVRSYDNLNFDVMELPQSVQGY